MILLDLPLEILDEIIELTLPCAIESFVRTCKAIHVRARVQIQRHNALKQKWRHVNIASAAHSFSTFHAMSQDLLVAQYVESLSFWDPDVEVDDIRSHLHSIGDFRTDDEAMSRTAGMITSAEYLKDAGVDIDGWWQRIITEADAAGEERYDADEPIVTSISLLALLPNLKTLQLWPGWNDVESSNHADRSEEELISVVESLVRRANRENDHELPLSKLETILPFMPEGYQARGRLSSLQPFLALKNLKELYAISCLAVNDDNYTGIPFHWKTPELNSALRRMELAYCCMDADGLSALLAHTPFLQVFKYSHQTKWHGCQHDWNPGTFIEALARLCGQAITELAITIDNLYGEIENGGSSFLSFPNLQYLETDVLIFCGPPVESGQVNGLNQSIPDGQKPWDEDDIPCIGSMLPDGIRDMQVNTDFPSPDEKALRALFKNLVT